MKTVYETKADLARERAAMVTYKEFFGGSEMVKLDKFNAYDYRVSFGHLVEYVEFKRRNNPMGKYPTLNISFNKIMKMKLNRTGVLLIQWDDKLAFICVEDIDEKSTLANWGRKDRPLDRNATEKVVQIATRDFTVIDG